MRSRGMVVLAVLWVASSGCGSSGGRAAEKPPPPPPPPTQPPPPPPVGFVFGSSGPWPQANQQYGSKEGIRESPVVGFTTDEAQNRWIATPSALYLVRAGETALRRYDGTDGLHLQGYPARYCRDRPIGASDPCPAADESFGSANGAGIQVIVGGGKDEVFVGYHGTHPWTYDCAGDGNGEDWCDPDHHSGKIDRVKLLPDGSLDVTRFDLVANNHGAKYWHDRDVQRLAFDHFVHAHALYAGTDHGVAILFPDQWRPPRADEWFDLAYQEWMGDHLHARVCYLKPCDNTSANQRMGDWRGLALDARGDLWHAGKWTAGLIAFDSDARRWYGRNGDAFLHAFGDPYGGPGSPNPPVFRVPQEGRDVNLTSVAVCPDGTVWFGTSGAEGVDETVAAFSGQGWTWYGAGELGLPERPVKDLACLPDGRLVVAGFSAGIAIWDPKTKTSVRVRAADGLIPSDEIQAVEVDRMPTPPTLHVATSRGAAAIRVLP